MPSGSRKKEGESAIRGRIDSRAGIKIKGRMYYPIKPAAAEERTLAVEHNPCAGKANGTSCGAGCVCEDGQCYYTRARLLKMGFDLTD